MYNVLVVGGGHAGVEAAHACWRLGLSCALVTLSEHTIGQMSCNPAIGGLGKSHLVKEIDAMGGIMPLATDMSGIQFRTLNTRKGPAVRALRVQCDRDIYKKSIQNILKQTTIDILEGEVIDLMVKRGAVIGVEVENFGKVRAEKIILTTGTFLNGIMYSGQIKKYGGRLGEKPSIPLSERMYGMGLPMGRLKTGTPPRIKMSSLDLDAMDEQPGDLPTPFMSSLQKQCTHPKQLSCFITRTSAKTKKIIEEDLHLSAMYSGQIQGIGPRYCPSIEDKVLKFKNKDTHQIFIEPEGINTDLVYPNGISTSLPIETQNRFVRTITGMEDSIITEYGYAVEYDFVDPRSLHQTLELKSLKNLYLAGQINGTTGYEEAAAQGLIAGINAALSIKKTTPFILDRSAAYIAVLISDLVSHGVTEPYRMFTSRAEHRLMLSQDTAKQRLTHIAYNLGLVGEEDFLNFESLEQTYQSYATKIKRQTINFGDKHMKGETLLKRTDIDTKEIVQTINPDEDNAGFLERLITECRYQGYIDKQQREIKNNIKNTTTKIPKNISYKDIIGLSNENIERLEKNQPANLGAAAMLEGITPASINLLRIFIAKHKNAQKSRTS